MKIAVAATVTAITCLLAGGLSAGPANADPSADATHCDFALTTPVLVEVPGGTMVTAKLLPRGCSGEAIANQSVVCLRAEPSTSNGQCTQGNTFDGSQVFGGYTPGTKYVATGTGCASNFDAKAVSIPGQSTCRSFGPISAVL